MLPTSSRHTHSRAKRPRMDSPSPLGLPREREGGRMSTRRMGLPGSSSAPAPMMLLRHSPTQPPRDPASAASMAPASQWTPPPEDPISESDFELEDAEPAQSGPSAQAPLVQMLGDAWREEVTKRTRIQIFLQGFAASIDQQLLKYQEAFPVAANSLTGDLKKVLKRHFESHLGASPKSHRPHQASHAEAARTSPPGHVLPPPKPEGPASKGQQKAAAALRYEAVVRLLPDKGDDVSTNG